MIDDVVPVMHEPECRLAIDFEALQNCAMCRALRDAYWRGRAEAGVAVYKWAVDYHMRTGNLLFSQRQAVLKAASGQELLELDLEDKLND